jgi:hypothetical protein
VPAGDGPGNRLAAEALEVTVVVEVSDREDARGFDSGRFAFLVDLFPPAVNGQQLIRARCADPRLVLEGDSRWLREP